jgi:hypothetical protein
LNLKQCGDSINRMVALRDGWDSYKAKAPRHPSLANAFTFCRVATHKGLEPQLVAASPMGGVAVCFGTENGHREVLVEFYNNGTAHSLFSDDRTEEMITAPVEMNLPILESIIEQARTYLSKESN